VRGFRVKRIEDANPHPTLSLAEGETEQIMNALILVDHVMSF
jgi:hypothetical protein